MTNHPQVISKHCVYPSSIGDHDMVGCVRKLNHLKYSPRTVFSRNYSTYDPAAMNEDFKNVNWCSIYMSRNVNTAVELLKVFLIDTRQRLLGESEGNHVHG